MGFNSSTILYACGKLEKKSKQMQDIINLLSPFVNFSNSKMLILKKGDEIINKIIEINKGLYDTNDNNFKVFLDRIKEDFGNTMGIFRPCEMNMVEQMNESVYSFTTSIINYTQFHKAENPLFKQHLKEIGFFLEKIVNLCSHLAPLLSSSILYRQALEDAKTGLNNLLNNKKISLQDSEQIYRKYIAMLHYETYAERSIKLLEDINRIFQLIREEHNKDSIFKEIGWPSVNLYWTNINRLYVQYLKDSDKDKM